MEQLKQQQIQQSGQQNKPRRTKKLIYSRIRTLYDRVKGKYDQIKVAILLFALIGILTMFSFRYLSSLSTEQSTADQSFNYKLSSQNNNINSSKFNSKPNTQIQSPSQKTIKVQSYTQSTILTVKQSAQTEKTQNQIGRIDYTDDDIKTIIVQTNLQNQYKNNTITINSVTQQMHRNAIQRLQLSNSFEQQTQQPQRQTDISNPPINLDTSSKNKQQKSIQKLQKTQTQLINSLQHTKQLQLIEQQFIYYSNKYNIQQYKQLKNISFCIIVPVYNTKPSSYYKRNINSILRQNYTNFHAVFIDDNSQDNIATRIEQYIDQQLLSQTNNQYSINAKFTVNKSAIKIIRNQKKVTALENIYNNIHSYCKDEQVVVLVDGDDALIGREVLSLLNSMYQQGYPKDNNNNKPALVYSKYLLLQNNTALLGRISRPIRPSKLRNNLLRKQKVFYTSHLLTFNAGLFKQIKRQDLCDQHGMFFQAGYDVAIMLPMLQMSYPHIRYVPQILYEYNYDGVNNDRRDEQDKVSQYIYTKKLPYQRMTKEVISRFLY